MDTSYAFNLSILKFHLMFRNILKKILPQSATNILQSGRMLARSVYQKDERSAFVSFFKTDYEGINFLDKLKIIKQLHWVSLRVESPHAQNEILSFTDATLSLPKGGNGILIEAGCFKGGSTSKFSLAAHMANRSLFVFDSFEGIPENDEEHTKNIFGGGAGFAQGDYCGPIDEVKSNIEKYGKLEQCTFVKGWLDDTLPDLKQPVSVAYIDVDLVSSTKTALKYIYPLLEEGGVLFSQDCHLPLVIELFDDDDFWQNEVGCAKPYMEGLRTRKLVKVVKGSS